MNPFERFGIKHLSPSSLNLWVAAPGLWALRYLGGVRDDAGPAAWRGRAVEQGLTSWLLRKDNEEALDAALGTFEGDAVGLADDDTDAERELIAPMLETAIVHCAILTSKLFTTQARIEISLSGIDVPILGYADFIFEDGSILELKTTKQRPSSPRPDHARQVSTYHAAKKAPVSILYVTDKRAAIYPIGDNEAAKNLSDLRDAGLSLQRFLARAPDAQEAILSLPMDQSNFRWSEAASQKLAELHRS